MLRDGFELQYGLEISDLFLDVYACNWPIDIQSDLFHFLQPTLLFLRFWFVIMENYAMSLME